MSCRGVHFALSEVQTLKLEAMPNDALRLEHISELIEPDLLGTPYAAESDKSWDALHRTLSDGILDWSGGEYPLNHTVLGGKPLYYNDDYIMSLKTPTQVKDIAAKLVTLDKQTFQEHYYSIPANDYDVELTDDDLEYTWSYFHGIRELFNLAAKENRFVLFTADQ